MTDVLLTIAQVFGMSIVMVPSISFVIGLLHTLSIKGALEYVKASLVIPFIGLVLYIICYGVVYVIFYVLDLPYL